MEAPSWARRLAGSLLVGAIQGMAYYIMIVYVVPGLYSGLQESLGAQPAIPTTRIIMGLGFLLLAISVAARALRGHVASPLLSAAGAPLAFAATLYILGGGVVAVSGVEVEDAVVSASLDLRPLLAVAFVFYVVPGILLPLAEYFYEVAEEGA